MRSVCIYLGLIGALRCASFGQHAPEVSARGTSESREDSKGNTSRETNPLPTLRDEWLLGAPNVKERDAVFEGVVRCIATETNYACYYVGFETFVNQPGSHYVLHDPRSDFLSRFKGMESRVKPLSAAKWIQVEDLPIQEVAGNGVRCMIWGVKLLPMSEAEVDVRFETHRGGGSARTLYHLRLEGEKWRVTSHEVTGIFG